MKLKFIGKWIDSQCIILSMVTQSQKEINHMFPLICRIQPKIYEYVNEQACEQYEGKNTRKTKDKGTRKD